MVCCLGLSTSSPTHPSSRNSKSLPFSRNPASNKRNLPRKMFGFFPDETEHKKQMADVQRAVKYLAQENETPSVDVTRHFAMDNSGMLPSIGIDTHAQSVGAMKLSKLDQQRKEPPRRPSSSWGRKLGPRDPIQADNRPDGYRLPGMEPAEKMQQGNQFQRAIADGGTNQISVNAHLTAILLFCAIILSVRNIPIIGAGSPID